jgi:hypothetical protein
MREERGEREKKETRSRRHHHTVAGFVILLCTVQGSLDIETYGSAVTFVSTMSWINVRTVRVPHVEFAVCLFFSMTMIPVERHLPSRHFAIGVLLLRASTLLFIVILVQISIHQYSLTIILSLHYGMNMLTSSSGCPSRPSQSGDWDGSRADNKRGGVE